MSLQHQIAFALIKGNNPTLAQQILNRLGSEQEFFELSESTLASRLEFKGQFLGTAYRQQLLQQAEAEVEFIAQHNVKCHYFTDATYPQRLLECEDAPLMLFGLGDTNLNATHIVSIVGTRNATTYGVNFISHLVDELAQRLDDVLVISGLAVGCDITAHKRAIDNHIPTIGIVAHGLDTLYPAEHRNFAARMIREGGMMLTDYPHATHPHRGNFLARNRIVAGMSDCVVVAESAANRGGALHTARLAQLYNRDVFALPGRTSDLYSGGCNMLIKQNVAHLVESADDIIKTMNWKCKPSEGTQKQLFPELSPQQQAIIDVIRHNGEAQVNTLTTTLNMPVGQLMASLVELEFNGLLVSLPGARYRMA